MRYDPPVPSENLRDSRESRVKGNYKWNTVVSPVSIGEVRFEKLMSVHSLGFVNVVLNVVCVVPSGFKVLFHSTCILVIRCVIRTDASIS